MRCCARATTLLLALVAASAFAIAASAAPIQYDFHSGRVEIGIFTDDGTQIVATQADLVGTYVTFDEAGPELVDFELIVDDDDVDLAFFGTVDLQIATTPGIGFDAPAVDLGGWYRWDGGPVDVIGEITATSGLLLNLLGATPLPLAFSQDDAFGYFSTGAGPDDEQFGFFRGVTVTEVELFGVNYKLQIKDVFKGTVPEPGIAALLALGFGGIAWRRRR